MNNRKIAIECFNSTFKSAHQLIPTLNVDVKDITIFHNKPVDGQELLEGITYVEMPADIDTMPKSKNYIIKSYRDLVVGDRPTWLHVIEGGLKVNRDPRQFMDDIQNMMTTLDINSWLATTTDVCNRVYKKYNPRVKIVVDKPELQSLGIDEIRFCSHSNVQWMVFNIEKADQEELTFREDFKIAMYWIIEYLARRRNSHPGSIYYMNQYITCKSEENLFENSGVNESDKSISNENEAEQMQKEDAMFKALNVNYSPDNNIDAILEATWNKLKSKANI